MMIWRGKRSLNKRTFEPGGYINGWEPPAQGQLVEVVRAPGSAIPAPKTEEKKDGLRYVKKS